MGEYSSITRTGKDEPFNLHVARGYVQGHTPFFKFGYNPAVSSTSETIWDGGGIYSYPTSAAPLGVVGTSTTDSSEITVIGLDADYNEVSNIVTLNGTTTVTTSASYIRAYRAFVSNDQEPAGNVAIRHSGDLVAQITSGENQTLMAVYTVPAGYTLYIGRGSISTATEGTNQIVTGRLRVRKPGGVFRTAAAVVINNQFVDFDWETPLVVTEKSDIEATAIVSKSQENAVAATFEGILIKNESS